MAHHTTFLTLMNATPHSVTIHVTDTDNYDWDNQARPDHNLNGVTLNPRGSISRQEDLNAHARSAWGTMRLDFSNGQSCQFRFNQYDAHNGISPSPQTVVCQGASALSVVQRAESAKSTNSYTFHLDY